MLPKSLSLPDLPSLQKIQEPFPKHKLVRRDSQVMGLLKGNSISTHVRFIIRPKVIGKGRYSTVKLAIDTRTMKTAVAKIVVLPKNWDAFKQEVAALKRLKHPNVVIMIHSEIWNGKGILYLERLSKFTLTDYMDEVGFLLEMEALKVISQIVTGLRYVHERCVVHNDIKPENISYDSLTGCAKLFDFGLAFVVDPNSPNISFHGGSPLYMAPEVLHESHNPFLSDIWSLGITLYEIVIGEPPLSGCTDLKELVEQLATGSSHFYYPPNISSGMKNLISKMVHNIPQSRPSLRQIQNSISELTK